MTIVVRAIFHEKNKFYPQVFLDECLHKILKCYILQKLIFLKESMLIKQAHQKSVMFLTIGISPIIVLSFNQISAIDVMMTLGDIAILNIKVPDYRCIISLISKNEVIDLLQNADLTEKSGTL